MSTVTAWALSNGGAGFAMLREISMTLPPSPPYGRLQIVRDLHYFPVHRMPPSGLRYTRRVRGHSLTESWRSAADQPWISIYLKENRRLFFIQLCEVPQSASAASAASAAAILSPEQRFVEIACGAHVSYAFIAWGSVVKDSAKLVSMVRRLLSCDALMGHRGAGDGGLRAMAPCLQEKLMHDLDMRRLVRLDLNPPRLFEHIHCDNDH